ncbi:calmodulin-4-like isoform X2 [Physella acuta]|nr:calmodulin-4-like isoform X2 [Physella acuta]
MRLFITIPLLLLPALSLAGYYHHPDDDIGSGDDEDISVHRLLFQIFDSNHDGHISLPELKHFFKKHEHKAEALLHKLDKNHDNVISFKEFLDCDSNDLTD